MSPEQLTLIIWLFAAVILLSIVVVCIAVVIRKRTLRAYFEGPGSPSARVSTDPWERFGPALAAVYARPEWVHTRESKRKHSPEQTYFGYGSVLPFATLRKVLSTDWHVNRADQAKVQVRNTVGIAARSAAQYAAARGETELTLRARLVADGAPEQAAEFIASHIAEGLETPDEGVELLPDLAFDIARFANLVRWAGCVGYLDYLAVREASDVLATAALTGFSSWNEFGEAYIEGLHGYTKHGRRPFLDAIEWLTTSSESPWKALAWPLAGGTKA
ncbi:DUF1266 domain-containing protein [Leucobacter denitrificans]|uniref:DUF1266 domain-containing protein n=1 Tax=Leucobacter denitrificans TaxID=683042 RepID=A0A7G9S4B1_9MICO|nr:DUF1266 domain-containing protein [Leucobacter denitrificans]QNN62686.1 DUF1266 domain-containing protein [Leucobacter denitrificans]